MCPFSEYMVTNLFLKMTAPVEKGKGECYKEGEAKGMRQIGLRHHNSTAVSLCLSLKDNP